MRRFDRGGKILSAQDHGTIWEVAYRDRDGRVGSVYFDHRPFACFYEGATGRSFFADYRFGGGGELISNGIRGLRIRVEGEFPEQAVELE